MLRTTPDHPLRSNKKKRFFEKTGCAAVSTGLCVQIVESGNLGVWQSCAFFLMKTDIRILMVEDSTADACLMDRELRKGGLSFETRRIETKEEFLCELNQNRPDLILLDHGLPTFDGFTA